jgi:ribonuclease inhibitor
MELIIEGMNISSEDDFHDAIAEGLALPHWYGRNLDALWDVLTGMVGRPLKMVWTNADHSKKSLPRFEKIISLLRDVEVQDRQLQRSDPFTLEIR